uniref:Uncharacterized protein n=1 Tax=Opuntia streptacantha TaxID=393608 RepID=A0A7C9DEB5_OPUST
MVLLVRGRGRQRGSRLRAVGSGFNSPAASISPSRRHKHRCHHSGSLSFSFARLRHRVGVVGCEGFGALGFRDLDSAVAAGHPVRRLTLAFVWLGSRFRG